MNTRYFHVVLLVTLYMVVLTFMSLHETLVCYNSNESFVLPANCQPISHLYPLLNQELQEV